MVWCHQAASHYPNQWWPSSVLHMVLLGHNKLMIMTKNMNIINTRMMRYQYCVHKILQLHKNPLQSKGEAGLLLDQLFWPILIQQILHIRCPGSQGLLSHIVSQPSHAKSLEIILCIYVKRCDLMTIVTRWITHFDKIVYIVASDLLRSSMVRCNQMHLHGQFDEQL